MNREMEIIYIKTCDEILLSLDGRSEERGVKWQPWVILEDRKYTHKLYNLENRKTREMSKMEYLFLRDKCKTLKEEV